MLARAFLMRGAAAAASGLSVRASEAARCAALVPHPLPRFTSRFAGQRSQPSSLVVRSYSDGPAAAEALEEVDWDKRLINNVRVLGPVAGKEVRTFERGGKKLSFVVGVKPDSRNKPNEIDWYAVEAWGPLAERAEHLIAKGNQVAVEGRLKTEKWQDKQTGAPRSAIRILASSIQKVRSTLGAPGGDSAYAGGYPSSGQEAPWDAQPQAAAASGWDPQPGLQQSAPASGRTDVESLWMDLFSNPEQWYDNRGRKSNPKAPDFKKKEGGRDAPALWITGRDTPSWVLHQVPDLKSQS